MAFEGGLGLALPFAGVLRGAKDWRVAKIVGVSVLEAVPSGKIERKTACVLRVDAPSIFLPDARACRNWEDPGPGGQNGTLGPWCGRRSSGSGGGTCCEGEGDSGAVV